MIKNYFKLAWRNILKNKLFSFVNISGLAIGLSCFLLIALYIQDELSFDRYNAHADRLYRVNTDAKMGGVEALLPMTSDMMGGLLKKDYPEVEEYTRIYTFNGSKLIKGNNEYIMEENVAHVDSTFFDVFTLPAIDGNTKTALDEPNSVVLTRSYAKKYFGTVNVVGRTLDLKENGVPVAYRINAVIEDIPENSHFRFNMLFSMRNANYQWGQIGNLNFYTYLLLKKGTDYKAFEKKLDQFTERYLLPYIYARMNIKSRGEFEKAGNKASFSLIPVTDIHLFSDRPKEIGPQGNIQYIYIFAAVALFILIIACFNFMNLSTARSTSRAREVGIRKVLGTGRRELVSQFLVESVLTCILSMLIAVGIVLLMLPAFNTIADKMIGLRNIFKPELITLIIGLPLVTGILAGIYPAFFLSAFRPIEVLKGKLKMNGKSVGLRSVLVAFQFAACIILIIGTLVIYRQLHFIQNRNIGFNKDQLLVIDGAGAMGNNLNAFRNSVLRLSGVQSGTITAYLPVSNSSRNSPLVSKNATIDADNSFNMQNWSVDYDYLKTMGMKVVSGRGFSLDYGGDSSAVVINEATAKMLQYDDPVGKQLYVAEGGRNAGYTIIGVVQNFNYESLHQAIGPLGLFLRGSTDYAVFKVNTSNMDQVLTQIRDTWKTMAPEVPYSYHFLDKSFDAMYRSEERVGKISMVFSILAIAIACLGIFGLATFIAEQRTKEMGIRKVLGANMESLVVLLTKDFVRLVIIAFVIAAPIGWWIMHKWLQGFAYRISIGWWVFLVAGVTVLVIALLTVSYQSIKAALANPLRSLRME